MSYTLIDHELSPFSRMDEIEAWERRIETMLNERPDDEGLVVALKDVRMIKKLAEEMALDDLDRHR